MKQFTWVVAAVAIALILVAASLNGCSTDTPTSSRQARAAQLTDASPAAKAEPKDRPLSTHERNHLFLKLVHKVLPVTKRIADRKVIGVGHVLCQEMGDEVHSKAGLLRYTARLAKNDLKSFSTYQVGYLTGVSIMAYCPELKKFQP